MPGIVLLGFPILKPLNPKPQFPFHFPFSFPFDSPLWGTIVTLNPKFPGCLGFRDWALGSRGSGLRA